MNLTGALIVALAVGYVMSVRIGGPPFRELFPHNFLRAFVPYLLAALVASKFTPRLGGRGVADYVFVPLAGSSLSLALFYHSVAGFTLPPAEAAPVLIPVFAAYFLAYAAFGIVTLLALRSIVLVLGESS